MNDRVSQDHCERIFAGETRLKVWAEFRDMDVSALRTARKIAVGRLENLLKGKGAQITEKEERALARTLNVPRVALRPTSFAGCSGDLRDEDEG